MANPTPVESTPSQAAETWREIESVVEYLARLSKSDLSPREFYAELLGRSVAALAAVGGAVWLCDRDGRLNLEFQTQFDRTGLANNAPELAVHDEVLHSVLPSPTAKAIAPGSGHGSELTNPTPFLMILRPVHAGEGPIGVLEIFQRPDTSPAAQKGYLELVNVVGELAAEFHKNRQLHSLQNRQTTWNRFDDFSQRVHSSLELSQTCYIVANDGRTLVGCDRVSVLIVHGRRCRTAAVSGVDLVDRRANLIRQLENVGRMVASTGDPLVYRGETAGFAPQVEVAVQAYVDESHVRSLTMVPLTPEDDTARRPRPIALLVFERFDSELDEDYEHRSGLICRHALPALKNSLAWNNLPLMPLQLMLGRVRRKFLLWTAALICLVGVTCALVFVRADFQVFGRGKLQPADRADIFAPDDGIIQSLDVAHAQMVTAGDVLMQLTNADLRLEITRVDGEIATAMKELENIEIESVTAQDNDQGTDNINKANKLAAERIELTKKLAGLDKERMMLLEQAAALTVTSPLDGQVLTWNVDQLLESRPVQQGQVLLTIVSPGDDWVVEMNVPDAHIGYVLASNRELQTRFEALLANVPEDDRQAFTAARLTMPWHRDDAAREILKKHSADGFPAGLKTTFVLATDPGTTIDGYVQDIGLATAAEGEEEPSVLVTIAFDRRDIDGLRPGATVTSRVECGRKALGYVWLHDLIETVRAWLFI